jgi:hypothetical protein
MENTRSFRPRHVTPRGTERVTRQPSDLDILEVFHRLGPQTVTALFQLLHPLYKNYRAPPRTADLRRECVGRQGVDPKPTLTFRLGR